MKKNFSNKDVNNFLYDLSNIETRCLGNEINRILSSRVKVKYTKLMGEIFSMVETYKPSPSDVYVEVNKLIIESIVHRFINNRSDECVDIIDYGYK